MSEISFVTIDPLQAAQQLHQAYQERLSESNATELIVMIRPSAPPPFQHVALGGTFDRLHAAHRLMLSVACCLASERVVVGITAPEMIQHKQHSSLIEPLRIRIERVKEFVSRLQLPPRLELVILHDGYGPTIEDASLQLLIVSEETRSGGEKINVIRGERGMPPLHLVPIPNLHLPDGQLLSSTLLRQQTISPRFK